MDVIGHTLGSLYSVVHRLAIAVLLPHVMQEFGAAVHKHLASLADVCGIDGANEVEKANTFLCWIEETNKKICLPDTFGMIRDQNTEEEIM